MKPQDISSDHLKDITYQAVALTAAGIVAEQFRGCVLGLDPVADGQEIERRKRQADERAKDITQAVFSHTGYRVLVHAAEGIGRDGVTNSFSAAEVVNPLGKSGEIHILSDVIEGTNATVSNNGGKSRVAIDRTEAGGLSAIVSGQGVIPLGNAPDMYADQFFSYVPEAKRAEVQALVEDSLTAEDVQILQEVLETVAIANGCSIRDLEVVIMKRDREARRLASLQSIRGRYPGLTITQISDGTVVHGLMASFQPNKKIPTLDRHKILWTAGGSAEAFMNLAVAASVPGGIGALRLCSKNVNKTAAGDKAKDLSRRYAFDANEINELRVVRNDAESILSGNRLFGIQDVKGSITANFSFITDNGVFDQPGVQKVRPGIFRVCTLRIACGHPDFVIEDKPIQAVQALFS